MGQDPNQPYSGPYGQPQPGSGYQGGYQQPGPGAYPPPNTGYPPPNPGYQQPNPGYPPPGPGYQYQQQYGQPQGMSPAAGQLGPTSMNMDANVAAGLSYILGWITGLIFFLMEKQNRFVRFHAMQSIILAVSTTVLFIVLDVLSVALVFTFIGCLFTPVLSLVGIGFFVLWLICLINAFQGKYFKLPIIGDMAERWANSGMPS